MQSSSRSVSGCPVTVISSPQQPHFSVRLFVSINSLAVLPWREVKACALADCGNVGRGFARGDANGLWLESLAEKRDDARVELLTLARSGGTDVVVEWGLHGRKRARMMRGPAVWIVWPFSNKSY